MTKCQKLKWYRKKLRLSQRQLGEKIGLCVATVVKLENDETAWATLKQSTVDKIMAFYDSVNTSDWTFNKEEAKKQLAEIRETIIEPAVEEVTTVEPEPEVVEEKPIHNEDSDLSDKDRQLMKYVEFACENLKSSKSHEEFVTGIDILKRIIENQY